MKQIKSTIEENMLNLFDEINLKDLAGYPTLTIERMDSTGIVSIRYPKDIDTLTQSQLIRMFEDGGLITRGTILAHPNCPEALRLWIKMGGFAGMSLREFMEKVEN